MRKLWLTLAAILAFALVQAPVAQAAPSTACPDTGNTQYIVDLAADATDLQEGYNNPLCDLIINTSIPVVVGQNYKLRAKSVTIQGPDALVPLNRVEIINSNPSGDIFIVAENGNVKIEEAIVKARDLLHIDCDAPATCKVDINNAEVMAPLNVLDPGGDLRVLALGDINIVNSTFYGGSILHITSKNGSILWFCPGGGDCKDPFQSGVAAVICPTFPCTPTFNTPSDLKAVCSQGVLCGGATVELRISAKIDVDIQGSTIVALDHVTVTAQTGKILAGPKAGNNTHLTGHKWAFVSFSTMDFTNAFIHTDQEIKMTAGDGCPAFPGICINLNGVDFESASIVVVADQQASGISACNAAKIIDLGGDQPRLNNEAGIGLFTNTLDTSGECGGNPPTQIE
jgi:hypothetical protein